MNVPRRFALLLPAAVAVASLAIGAVRVTDTRAASGSVQIVEPSVLPQSWGYSPAPMTAAVGDTVTWVNTGIAPHSVTAYDGSFDSGIMLTGATWSFSPAAPGTYDYYCTLHPDMKATLVVTE
jgi:plastocyanin